jgi:hypothetical protein
MSVSCIRAVSLVSSKYTSAHILKNSCHLTAWLCLQLSKLDDVEYAQKISDKAQEQVMRVFPILDILNFLTSIASAMNPMNYIRFVFMLLAANDMFLCQS